MQMALANKTLFTKSGNEPDSAHRLQTAGPHQAIFLTNFIFSLIKLLRVGGVNWCLVVGAFESIIHSPNWITAVSGDLSLEFAVRVFGMI